MSQFNKELYEPSGWDDRGRWAAWGGSTMVRSNPKFYLYQKMVCDIQSVIDEYRGRVDCYSNIPGLETLRWEDSGNMYWPNPIIHARVGKLGLKSYGVYNKISLMWIIEDKLDLLCGQEFYSSNGRPWALPGPWWDDVKRIPDQLRVAFDQELEYTTERREHGDKAYQTLKAAYSGRL